MCQCNPNIRSIYCDSCSPKLKPINLQHEKANYKTWTASFPGVYIGGKAIVTDRNEMSAKNAIIKAMLEEGEVLTPEQIRLEEYDCTKTNIVIVYNGDY